VVRDIKKPRACQLPSGVLTDDLREITSNPGIKVVAQLIGGLEPERTIMLRLLESGKDIVTANKALLAEHGYAQYEVSAYARPGQAARHNLNYWTFGDFLGIGAGAHAKLSSPDGSIKRSWKTRLPKDYLDRGKRFSAGERLLGPDELPFEFLMNVLRLTDGAASALFTRRTGLPLSRLAEARAQAEDRGLLQRDPGRLTATREGQLFLNDLLQHFLP